MRTVSPAVHANVTPAPGTKLHVTRPGAVSMPRLNVTTTGAAVATLLAPETGTVEVIWGGGQNAVNPHGLGAGPGPRLFPFVSLPETVTV